MSASVIPPSACSELAVLFARGYLRQLATKSEQCARAGDSSVGSELQGSTGCVPRFEPSSNHTNGRADT